MSAIFGETLTFGQEHGPDVRLWVCGDEFYAVHETLDGYTAVRDGGDFCYATLVNGQLVSSGAPVLGPAPAGIARHLRENPNVRSLRFEARRQRSRPSRSRLANEAALSFGPSQGLLEGRRLSSGKVRGLTLLVEFQDVHTTVTPADLDAMLNGANYTRNGNFCSAREYFRTVSTGKLDYTNDVLGPFRLSQPRSYYLSHLLVKEALDLAVASGVDLSRYDSRNEGVLDALNVLYAGQTQYDGELWPHNFSIDLQYGAISTNLYLLTSAGRSADELSIGTFCHENGHLLCRFPDMYDYGDTAREGDGVKSAGIGSYCLMGSGNHLNFGRTPAPVCAYLRDLAGWCDTEVVLNEVADAAAEHGRYDTVLKYVTGAPNEYFIVENRAKLGLDTHLPSSGLAVYHCDTLGSNEFQAGSAQKHYQCALLQADGRTDLERNVNQGDGDDLFSVSGGVVVSHDTSPSSRLWSGADSGLVIANVSGPGPSISFRVGAAAPVPSFHAEDTTRRPIPDNQPAGVTGAIAVAQAGIVRQLSVALDIAHTYIGDLRVKLTGPGGRSATLHDQTGGREHNLVKTYATPDNAALQTFVGQAMQGQWQLNVSDLAGQDTGQLNRWSLDAVLDGQARITRAEVSADLPIPDTQPAGIASSIAITDTGTVASLAVAIDITHTYIGDLRIELVAPTGRAVTLHAQLGGGQDNLVTRYDSAAPLSPLSALLGQPMQGNWTLRVADLAAVDVGRLNKWSVEMAAG